MTRGGVELPTGTATFLFTDIQGSTKLVQALGIERWRGILQTHYDILRRVFNEHDGREVNTEGDAFFIAFPQATHAVAACAAGQKELNAHDWPADAVIRVRMGLHTGEAAMVGGDYMGLDIHRAARIASTAHGGQVVLSDSTRVLVAGTLPSGVTLLDLGEHRLKDLAQSERIWQLVIDGLPRDFPPLKSLDLTPNNLPSQLTSFVGRDDEVARGLELLQGHRLLTLTGPGGTGKTRLSLQIAAEASERFKHGVCWVALASIVDSELVPSAILQALGIHDVGSRRPQDFLLEHLQERELLLVLDNFEQILPAGSYVAEILKGAPATRVVATSRAALRVYGEQEFPIPPLQVPDTGTGVSVESLAQSQSVKLFLERALSVKPDFRGTEENLRAIAAITELVDGLPLGIELAAAQVKLLAPPAILTRLRTRLGELGGGARDLPERQRTLRGAIAWSYELLDPGIKLVFARFAVFARGAALEEIEAVCGPGEDAGGDLLDALGVLVDHSLLRPAEQPDHPRFLMLHVIQGYAAERLAGSAEEGEVRRRHAAAYLALAKEGASHLMGQERKSWLDRLELEHDNLRAALSWAMGEGEVELAAGIVSALWRFWQMRGHLLEGRQRADDVLALAGIESHPEARYLALEAAGGIAHWQGDPEGSRGYYTAALEIARDMGDKRRLAEATYNAAFPSLVTRTNMAQAKELTDEAAATYRELGDGPGEARALWARANLYFRSDPPDHVAAIAILRDVRDIFRTVDDRFSLGWALYHLGINRVAIGETDKAAVSLHESLSIFSEVGDMSGAVLLLDAMAILAVARDDLDRAARLQGARQALEATSGVGLANARRVFLQEFDEKTQHLAESRPEAYAEGQAMTAPQAIAFALAGANHGLPARS